MDAPEDDILGGNRVDRNSALNELLHPSVVAYTPSLSPVRSEGLTSHLDWEDCGCGLCNISRRPSSLVIVEVLTKEKNASR